MKYTFCNTGTYFDFNPLEKIFPWSNSPPVKNIDFYMEMVKTRKSPSVYILDETGKIIK